MAFIRMKTYKGRCIKCGGTPCCLAGTRDLELQDQEDVLQLEGVGGCQRHYSIPNAAHKLLAIALEVAP